MQHQAPCGPPRRRKVVAGSTERFTRLNQERSCDTEQFRAFEKRVCRLAVYLECSKGLIRWHGAQSGGHLLQHGCAQPIYVREEAKGSGANGTNGSHRLRLLGHWDRLDVCTGTLCNPIGSLKEPRCQWLMQDLPECSSLEQENQMLRGILGRASGQLASKWFTDEQRALNGDVQHAEWHVAQTPRVSGDGIAEV